MAPNQSPLFLAQFKFGANGISVFNNQTPPPFVNKNIEEFQTNLNLLERSQQDQASILMSVIARNIMLMDNIKESSALSDISIVRYQLEHVLSALRGTTEPRNGEEYHQQFRTGPIIGGIPHRTTLIFKFTKSKNRNAERRRRE